MVAWFKNLLLAITILPVFGCLAVAQNNANEFRARAMYEQAVRDVTSNEYERALVRLEEVEELLGSSNARISALRVEVLYNLERWTEAQSEYRRFFTYSASPDLSQRIAELSIQIDDKIVSTEQAEQRRQGTLDKYSSMSSACDGGDAPSCLSLADAFIEQNNGVDLETERVLVSLSIAAIDQHCRLIEDPWCEAFVTRKDDLQYRFCETCTALQAFPSPASVETSEYYPNATPFARAVNSLRHSDVARCEDNGGTCYEYKNKQSCRRDFNRDEFRVIIESQAAQFLISEMRKTYDVDFNPPNQAQHLFVSRYFNKDNQVWGSQLSGLLSATSEYARPYEKYAGYEYLSDCWPLNQTVSDSREDFLDCEDRVSVAKPFPSSKIDDQKPNSCARGMGITSFDFLNLRIVERLDRFEATTAESIIQNITDR